MKKPIVFKKPQIPPSVILSRDELKEMKREIAGDAWDASANRTWAETFNEFNSEDRVELTMPSKEEYIKSIENV